MVTPGTAALDALRALAGEGERQGARLLILGLVVLAGLLLWAILVFVVGAAWSFGARALVTLLVAGLGGAVGAVALRTRRG